MTAPWQSPVIIEVAHDTDAVAQWKCAASVDRSFFDRVRIVDLRRMGASVQLTLAVDAAYFAYLSQAMDDNARDAISAIIVELDYAASEIVQQIDDKDLFDALPVIAIGSELPPLTIALQTTHAEAAEIVDAVLERNPPDHRMVVKRCETSAGSPTIAVTLPAHLYDRVTADPHCADVTGLGRRILYVISKA